MQVTGKLAAGHRGCWQRGGRRKPGTVRGAARRKRIRRSIPRTGAWCGCG